MSKHNQECTSASVMEQVQQRQQRLCTTMLLAGRTMASCRAVAGGDGGGESGGGDSGYNAWCAVTVEVVKVMAATMHGLHFGASVKWSHVHVGL